MVPSIISIGNKLAKSINFDNIINKFAENQTRSLMTYQEITLVKY